MRKSRVEYFYLLKSTPTRDIPLAERKTALAKRVRHTALKSLQQNGGDWGALGFSISADGATRICDSNIYRSSQRLGHAFLFADVTHLLPVWPVKWKCGLTSWCEWRWWFIGAWSLWLSITAPSRSKYFTRRWQCVHESAAWRLCLCRSVAVWGQADGHWQAFIMCADCSDSRGNEMYRVK